MNYWYLCPYKDQNISVSEDGSQPAFDAINALVPLVKDHYKAWHGENSLLMTDQELYDDIKGNLQSGSEVPLT